MMVPVCKLLQTTRKVHRAVASFHLETPPGRRVVVPFRPRALPLATAHQLTRKPPGHPGPGDVKQSVEVKHGCQKVVFERLKESLVFV